MPINPRKWHEDWALGPEWRLHRYSNWYMYQRAIMEADSHYYGTVAANPTKVPNMKAMNVALIAMCDELELDE